MAWNPLFRTSQYDPLLAYLTITLDRVTLKLSDYHYDSAGRYRRIPLFYMAFSVKKYDSLESTIIIAKKFRNKHAPSILGDRFMRYGPQPLYRRHKDIDKTEIIGVCNCEDNRYAATWSEELFKGGPRERHIAYVGYGPQSELTQEAAYKEACIIREKMVALHYIPIEELRALVLNDPDTLDIQPNINNKKLTTIKRAA